MEATARKEIASERIEPAPEVRPAVAIRSTTATWVWKVWLPIPILFLILEVSFNSYFWKIPKLTPRSADYGYQFLLDVHQLHQPKPPGSVRLVAFGSSVSSSFDPRQVQSLLAAADPVPPVHVHRLLLPGIKPSDYRLFFSAERDVIQPDIAVLVLNLVDFLNPSFERDLKQQVRYVLPPWTTLRERGAYMPTSGKLDLELAGVSDVYRYRKLIRSALRDHGKLLLHHLRPRRATRGYGCYADGYTKPRFGLPVDGSLSFEYYVDPEWIRERGRVALSFAAGDRALAQRVETSPGWKSIQLALPGGGRHLLEVAADSGWTPRASGLSDDARLLGVMLRQPPPPSAVNGSAPPEHYPPLVEGQIDTFLRMGDATGERLAARWQATLQADTPFAKRFRRYRELKVGLRDEPFQPTGEYAELEGLVRELSEHGTFVVLVNSPESPFILKDYEEGPYYRGHLHFFERLAQRYPHVWFHDERGALSAEDFNDWHHANYIGALKMGSRYAHFVQMALIAWTEQHGRGS